jgi:hypothetical protein
MPIRKRNRLLALLVFGPIARFRSFCDCFRCHPATAAIWRVAARTGCSDPFSRGRGLGICRNL